MWRILKRLKSDKHFDINTTIDKEQLLNMYNNKYCNDLEKRIAIIGVLVNLGYYNLSKEFISKISETNDHRIYEILQWYKINFNIAIHDNDEYLVKTIIKRITEKFNEPEYYYTFITQHDIQEQMRIYNDVILPNMKLSLKQINKLDFYLVTYLWSLFSNKEHISLPKIEKQINKRLEGIKQKTNQSIVDIVFCENFARALVFNCSINPENQGKYKDIIKNLEICVEIIEKYFIYFEDNRRSELEDIILDAYGLLSTLTSDTKYSSKNTEFIKKFEKYISEYYSYISSGESKESETNFFELLERLVNEKNINRILNLFMREISLQNWSEIDKAKAFLDNSCDKDIKELISVLLVYSQFFQGFRINTDAMIKVLSKIKIPPIVESAMRYESSNINNDELISIISKLNSINLDANMFERIFKAFYKPDSFNIILMVIERLDSQKSDINNIYRNVITKIIDNDIIITYYEFEKLSDIILPNTNSLDIKNLVLQLAMVFEAYTEKFFNLLKDNVLKLNEALVNNKHIDAIIYNYLLFCIKYDNLGEIYEVKQPFEVLINKATGEKKAAFNLVLGQLFPELIKDNYGEILSYLKKQLTKDIKYWDEFEISIFHLLIREELTNPTTLDIPEDTIFEKDDKLYAYTNRAFNDYYKLANAEIVEKIEESKCSKLSLVNCLISKIAFSDKSKYFGLTSIPLPTEASGEEILKKLADYTGWNKRKEQANNLNSGNSMGFLFNTFDTHSLFKNIQQMYDGSLKSNLFSNIDNNKLLLEMPKVIHPSSLILLAVINALEIIELNKLCYVTESIYNDILEKFSYQTNDLADGVLEKKVFFEDSLDKLAVLLAKLNEENRIKRFPTGSLLSNNVDARLSEFDKDIFRILLDKKGSLSDFIISDDKYYYITDSLKGISSGSYALAIESHIKGHIDDNKLLKISEDLNKVNYTNLFSRNTISYLISRIENDGSNKTLEKVIGILNENKS